MSVESLKDLRSTTECNGVTVGTICDLKTAVFTFFESGGVWDTSSYSVVVIIT